LRQWHTDYPAAFSRKAQRALMSRIARGTEDGGQESLEARPRVAKGGKAAPRKARPLDSPARTSKLTMRSRIKATATELFIHHGYRGVSFGDIANILGITRANIHYHFGNKQKLLEEVLEDYVDATLAKFRKIWSDDQLTFEQKVEATSAFNRQRYMKFNTGRLGGRPWSLIARMRSDDDVIGDYASRTLKRFARELSTYIEEAIVAAIARGELRADSPVGDIVVQAVSIANSAGTVTQDAGNFEQLESLYSAFLRTTWTAYGAETGDPAGKRRTSAKRQTVEKFLKEEPQ
jgi:AcrR family transcriptional regulator